MVRDGSVIGGVVRFNGVVVWLGFEAWVWIAGF
jgi:hypothetical protein